MKVPLKERLADFIVSLIRPFIVLIMEREIKVQHEGLEIPKDREPFFLISNHFNTWDSFAIMKKNKKKTRFVATEVAYYDLSKRLPMQLLARTIRKKVGMVDFTATREIFKYLKMGYAIGVFPEGDNTFYGETIDIYENTGRLLKKAGVDVIITKQEMGYISQPRWADYFAKRGKLFTYTKVLLTKDEVKELSAEEITEIVREALYVNDYDVQRKRMIEFNRKNRAEGIERVLYYCNKCGGVKTLSGKGHDIECSTCGTIATINSFEFLENNTFDNLVDYNHFQYEHIDEVITSEFDFNITLNEVNRPKFKNMKKGKFLVSYKDKTLRLHNKKATYTFDMTKMKHQVCTMRHSFTFDYEGITYNFTDIRHQFMLFEMLRKINGSYKL